MSIEVIANSVRALAPMVKGWTVEAELLLLERAGERCARPEPLDRRPHTGALLKMMAKAAIDARNNLEADEMAEAAT